MPTLSKNQKMARIAMLAAITLLLAMTPLGYIPLNPLITITIMVTPVVLGGLLYGWPAGLLLGLVFGISSFVRAPTEPLGQLMLSMNGFLTLAACVLPRALVGLLAGFAHRLVVRSAKLRREWFYALAGLCGSLINTLCFLGFITLAFDTAQTEITGKVILGIVTGNGLFEAIANSLLVAILAKVLLRTPKGGNAEKPR